ncbi:hypothetical protein ACFQH2_18505 [Natronoarchaeum sp. GCM10025703]|uniref:hypothetical protein n=1 Tax=unclassified Natronoarchaeum TaxID=2620183 RepID=UPI003616D153
MAVFREIDVRQRVGAGFLFLIIAIALLVTQPADQVLSAILAGINLLISAFFLVTVGRDTTEEPTYDVGLWLLSMVVALSGVGGYVGAYLRMDSRSSSRDSEEAKKV